MNFGLKTCHAVKRVQWKGLSRKLAFCSLVAFQWFCVVGLFSSVGQCEDSDSLRPYVHVRSAAFNENWGVQDGWGLSLGVNLNRYAGVELAVDEYENVVEDSQLGDIFEQSIINFTPQFRLRYPIGEGRWVPYIFAGPGVTFLHLNDRKPPAFHRQVESEEVQFSAVFGGGIEYFVADNITFNIEGKYALIGRNTLTVDGVERQVDYSSPLLMFGIRAYFRENHKTKLIKKDEEINGRFYGGVRYGSSILTDGRLNPELKLESMPSNPSGTVLVGWDLGEHFGIEVSGGFAEYVLASDRYPGEIGEYSCYTLLPQARWRWLFLDGKLSPFVTVGGGIMYSEFNDRRPGGEFVDIEAKGMYPAVIGSGGVECYLARNLSLSVEAQHVTSWRHRFKIQNEELERGSFSALNIYLGMRFYLSEH